MDAAPVISILSIALFACLAAHIGAIVMMRLKRLVASHKLRKLSIEDKNISLNRKDCEDRLTAVRGQKSRAQVRLGWLIKEKASQLNDQFRFLHVLGSRTTFTSPYVFQVILNQSTFRLSETLRGLRASPELWEKRNFVEVYASDVDAAERLIDFAFPRNFFSRVFQREMMDS